MEILSRLEAVLTDGHFVYTSGKHGSAYVNKDAIYPHTSDTAQLCSYLVDHFTGHDIHVVVGPEKGGIILSQWTANGLTMATDREVFGGLCEKDDDRFIIKRGYEKLLGKNILIVEDILTTGGQ